MHMRRLKRSVRSGKKMEILTALRGGDYAVSKLSQLHGISRSCIYKWIKEKQVLETGADGDIVDDPGFVELSVKEESMESPVLEKASLTFSNYSISLEGRLSGNQLISIIRILGE
jgi:transposase-like protein